MQFEDNALEDNQSAEVSVCVTLAIGVWPYLGFVNAPQLTTAASRKVTTVHLNYRSKVLLITTTMHK
jgi:hypothetical protein